MIIVTGGAGFIGSNIVRGLNRQGYTDILIVDDLKNGEKCRNLNALLFRDYVDKDIFLLKADSFFDKKTEAVFHQGACTDTMEHDGEKMMSMNYEYTKHLFHKAMGNKTRFFYASSASVYGNGEKGFSENPAHENPLNIYAFSKYLFDRYLRANAGLCTAQVAGLRYFNVYGQQENHKGRMASTVYHFYHQLKETGEARLFQGSEEFKRDFIYVDDVVEVNLFLLNHPEISGIYNCGTGEAASFIRIAESLVKLMKKGKLATIPFPEALKGKYQSYTQADMSALRKAGFSRPFTTLEDGVTRYYEYLHQYDGFIPYTERCRDA
jgi:ADP-L-glycero-D-manno-heptose 6-epimerase